MPDRDQAAGKETGKTENKTSGKQHVEMPDPESSQSMDPFVMQTQRGQAKEDGDPSQEGDQSVNEQNTRP